MSNLNTTSSSTITSTIGSNTAGTWNVVPCGIHGWQPCSCNAYAGAPFQQQYQCPSCLMWVFSGSNLHSCSGTGTQGFVSCGSCGQSYLTGTPHSCIAIAGSFTTGTTTTWRSTSPNFKEVKEITTDNELIVEWDGISTGYHIKLPQKFSDCFLKVGYSWSPLYPLIFSAFEGDSTEMSFHLVTTITEKTFEGDFVVLRAITTTKIEDNLTLMQLSHRTKEYFKEDDKTNSPVQ